jgi:hypothetical protein
MKGAGNLSAPFLITISASEPIILSAVVLLDAEGKIASPIATGGPAVLALAGVAQHELKAPTA